eukprot:CAMPEP_0113626408 /NCGR_PEP_ID=MMETSP0017_2-20120614/13657_1 /TAXON_ID=2856 /ORGANISM="Cylindrotheca closterium" /LENGTH=196 /DNA_ID=CAMNT_0000536587 /DNA_START=177 /DNA_END=763 /DNA_ORIENTATION=- /assembly_acc=CAM_ASM_000147
METSDDVQCLFTKAKECAYSEDNSEYSEEEAFKMLQDLTFLLSHCRYGVLGTHNAVCEDQDVAADVVARLRVKAASATAEAAVAESEEESTWKSIIWTALTKLQIPMAVIYYIACILFMMQYGELGVNSVDFAETNSKVNEYYMSASNLPACFPIPSRFLRHEKKKKKPYERESLTETVSLHGPNLNTLPAFRRLP